MRIRVGPARFGMAAVVALAGLVLSRVARADEYAPDLIEAPPASKALPPAAEVDTLPALLGKIEAARIRLLSVTALPPGSAEPLQAALRNLRRLCRGDLAAAPAGELEHLELLIDMAVVSAGRDASSPDTGPRERLDALLLVIPAQIRHLQRGDGRARLPGATQVSPARDFLSSEAGALVIRGLMKAAGLPARIQNQGPKSLKPAEAADLARRALKEWAKPVQHQPEGPGLEPSPPAPAGLHAARGGARSAASPPGSLASLRAGPVARGAGAKIVAATTMLGPSGKSWGRCSAFEYGNVRCQGPDGWSLTGSLGASALITPVGVAAFAAPEPPPDGKVEDWDEQVKSLESLVAELLRLRAEGLGWAAKSQAVLDARVPPVERQVLTTAARESLEKGFEDAAEAVSKELGWAWGSDESALMRGLFTLIAKAASPEVERVLGELHERRVSGYLAFFEGQRRAISDEAEGIAMAVLNPKRVSTLQPQNAKALAAVVKGFREVRAVWIFMLLHSHAAEARWLELVKAGKCDGCPKAAEFKGRGDRLLLARRRAAELYRLVCGEKPARECEDMVFSKREGPGKRRDPEAEALLAQLAEALAGLRAGDAELARLTASVFYTDFGIKIDWVIEHLQTRNRMSDQELADSYGKLAEEVAKIIDEKHLDAEDKLKRLARLMPWRRPGESERRFDREKPQDHAVTTRERAALARAYKARTGRDLEAVLKGLAEEEFAILGRRRGRLDYERKDDPVDPKERDKHVRKRLSDFDSPAKIRAKRLHDLIESVLEAAPPGNPSIWNDPRLKAYRDVLALLAETTPAEEKRALAVEYFNIPRMVGGKPEQKLLESDLWEFITAIWTDDYHTRARMMNTLEGERMWRYQELLKHLAADDVAYKWQDEVKGDDLVLLQVADREARRREAERKAARESWLRLHGDLADPTKDWSIKIVASGSAGAKAQVAVAAGELKNRTTGKVLRFGLFGAGLGGGAKVSGANWVASWTDFSTRKAVSFYEFHKTLWLLSQGGVAVGVGYSVANLRLPEVSDARIDVGGFEVFSLGVDVSVTSGLVAVDGI